MNTAKRIFVIIILCLSLAMIPPGCSHESTSGHAANPQTATEETRKDEEGRPSEERKIESKTGEEPKGKDNPEDLSEKTVESAYPGLASGALTYALLGMLPEGILLRAGEVTITTKDLDAEIAKAPAHLREQLKKYKFFLLEQTATAKLLLLVAQKDAAEKKKDISGKTDNDVITEYLQNLAAAIQVTDKEVTDFYEENKTMVPSGVSFEQVKEEIRAHLLNQKQQKAVREHIVTIAKRIAVTVSAPWVKEQDVVTKDNPVDKARASGMPTFVEFGASGCVPCDMMQPILENLRKKYAGKLNIIFVHVGQEPVLGARYGIQAIPVQVFFDKDGKEFFRHLGFYPQAEIEKKLSEIGVK